MLRVLKIVVFLYLIKVLFYNQLIFAIRQFIYNFSELILADDA